jgi:tetratricopeptide (TPR) repeat protein
LGLGQTYIRIGKYDEVIRAWETAAQLLGHSPFALGCLGCAYAAVGRIGEAMRLLEELQDLARKTYVSPWSFGAIYYGLREIDRAFDWFEKAVDERDGAMFHFHIDPAFDRLRSHPRYPALLRKMNLEP